MEELLMTFDAYKKVMPSIDTYLSAASIDMNEEQKQKLIQERKVINDILWSYVDPKEKMKEDEYWAKIFKNFGERKF
jgi:hypothetical protein